MMALVDVALVAPREIWTWQYGIAPAVALVPSLTLLAVIGLGLVAPAFAQEPAPEPASGQGTEAEPASPEEPSSAEAEPTPPEEVPTIPVTVAEPAAPPESARGPRFDDIQVTASKRLKSQRDIPGSVGAIGGLDLEKMNAQGMKDYLKLVPGVTFIDQGDDDSIPIIRGVSVSLESGATAGTTGIYLDDMPFADLLGSSSFPDLNPFDLERVEVLKGPQGTLFGSGALAGAVRYIVERPKHGIWETKFSGTWSQTELSAEPSQVAAAAVNMPLFGDAVALRGVFVQRDQAGIYDESAADANGNVFRYEEDVDKIDQASWRLLASWQVLDNLKASAFWFDQHTATRAYGFSSDPEDAHWDAAPFPSPRNSDFGGGNLLITWDFEWARVLSTTNRMVKDVLTQNHQEGLLLEQLGQQNQNEYLAAIGSNVKGWTQELRLMSPEGGTGAWEWLAGAAFLHYGAHTWQYSNLGADRPDPASAEDVSQDERQTAYLFSESDEVAEEVAYFGEITRRLGEHWEATLGARQYTTTLDDVGVICGAQIIALFPGSTGCRPDQFHDEDTGLNPKVALRYLHDRNIQAYVLAAKGFQFGGVQINPPAPGFREATEREGYKFAPFKSSELWNYELGLRTEWLDRMVRFDVALFYLDWTELQLSITVPLVESQPDTGFGIIANVGRAHSEGLESALEVLPFPGAKFTSAATWMNAVTDVPFDEASPRGPVHPGTRLPGTPRFQWTNVASYEHELAYLAGWLGGFTLTHVHLGSSPDQIRPSGTVGGYDTLDARVTVTRPSSRFVPELSAGVTNLTDVRGLTYHSNVNGTDLNHFVTPRTTLVSVSWRF